MKAVKTDKKSPRIVFMGTPDFAVESLKALIENEYNVVGVITMPDKPAGRGYKLQHSPVKRYALEQGLTILQPENLKDKGFLDELKQLKADLQVVVAFRMLPEIVWSMPPKGTFNLHASLLPQYRGAAPINWAIINGESETGVTTFFISHEIDTGKIIFQEKTTITPDDTAGTLHDRLMVIGAKLVLKTVDAIMDNSVKPTCQSELIDNEASLKPAPKIFKADCNIDWRKGVQEINNFVRGLSPYPAAWTELFFTGNEEGIRVKIFACEIIENRLIINDSSTRDVEHAIQEGVILTDNKSYMHVVAGDGLIGITDLQLSGKKRLNIIGFLNGYKLDKDSCFQ